MVSSKKSKYKSIKQSGQSFFQTGNKVLWLRLYQLNIYIRIPNLNSSIYFRDF
jgi:hypothetical protein